MSEMQNQLLKIVKFTKVENGCQEYEKYSDSAERNKRMWLKHPHLSQPRPSEKIIPFKCDQSDCFLNYPKDGIINTTQIHRREVNSFYTVDIFGLQGLILSQNPLRKASGLKPTVQPWLKAFLLFECCVAG